MPAGIEIQANGTASFVGAREPAWHRLGKIYENVDGITVAQVLADLDVGKVVGLPIQGTLITPDGVTVVDDPTKKMTVRVRSTGITPLGVVGADYTIVSEAEGFGFIDNIVDSGEALVSSAGLLNDGRKAFCCLKLPTNVLIGGVDEVDMYLFIVLGHDGSCSVTAAVTPIRVVCQNTVTYGLQMAKHTWSVRHTKNAVMRVEEARRSLALTHKYVDAWQVDAESMLARKMTKRQYESLVTKIYGPTKAAADRSKAAQTGWERKLGTLLGLWSADTQDSIKNTAWGAFNAIAEFEAWCRPTRGADDADARRFQSMLISASGEKGGPIDRINQARTLVLA